RSLWDQVLTKTKSQEVYEGLGIALLGSGDHSRAEKVFKQAEDLGSKRAQFVLAYHLAASQKLNSKDGAKACARALDRIRERDLSGFELQAVNDLKKVCEEWKDRK